MSLLHVGEEKTETDDQQHGAAYTELKENRNGTLIKH